MAETPSWQNSDGTGAPEGLEKAKALGKGAFDFISSKISRLTGAGLPVGAESAITQGGHAQWFTRDQQTDWRVKITLPSESDFKSEFLNSKVMQPLVPHGGVVFPLTPSMIIQHAATYNPLAVTHNNYPFYAYQNSETTSLTIIGEFPVQNFKDAQHWVATFHFLRTMTKMFFGGDQALRGNPPPVLRLNGYGNYVFKNVPVVLTNFTVELTNNTDYISTAQNFADMSQANSAAVASAYDFINQNKAAGKKPTKAEIEQAIASATAAGRSASTGAELGWAPVSSIFTVQVQPVYSRAALKNFSLQAFARGDLNNTGSSSLGDGESSEGIGFI